MNANALYAGLLRVPDRPTQDVLRQQADAITALGQAVQTLNGRPQPKVPAFNEIKAALQANGVAPLVISGLPGVATSATYGTHADRPTATSQTEGSFYFETDRAWLYINENLSSGRVWAYVAGVMAAVVASRPADLGTSDASARFYATDKQQLYRWTGATWTTEGEAGIVVLGTNAQRLTAPFGSWRYAAGTQFYETDRNYYYVAQNAAGTAATNGTVVTWSSGDLFKSYQVGAPITVNGTLTTIAGFTSSTGVTVADNLGVHAGVAYSIAAGKWVWAAGLWFDAYANRPTSLTGFGVDDLGAMFYATDYTHAFEWRYDNSAAPTFRWLVLFGLMRGTFAARPVGLSATDVFSDNGFLFFATDRNHTWRWNSFSSLAPATAYWDVRPEFSYPLTGTLSPDTKPAGLTVHDAGFRFMSTDFSREYTWGGAAWADSDGQDERDYLAMRRTAPTQNGWHLCDGTAGVTISKSDGTTTTVTVPTLNAATFPRGNAAYSGPTATAAVAPTTVAHHHAIADQNTGAPSATETVDNTLAGSTVAVGSATHVHDVPPQNTGDATVVVNPDGLPQYMDLLPYWRL